MLFLFLVGLYFSYSDFLIDFLILVSDLSVFFLLASMNNFTYCLALVMHLMSPNVYSCLSIE